LNQYYDYGVSDDDFDRDDGDDNDGDNDDADDDDDDHFLLVVEVAEVMKES